MKKNIVRLLVIAALGLSLSGCSVFGPAKKKKCLPCGSKRSEIEFKQVKPDFEFAVLDTLSAKKF